MPLSLQPEIGGLATLNGYIEAFAEEHGVSAADVGAISLAAEELFANTIHHSEPPATSVEFALSLADGVVTAVYSDDAAAFDPTLHPAPDTTLPADQRPIGGLGIHFVRKTMPSFRYSRVDGRNVITFGRPLAGK